jgi:hypothetical protein
LDAEGGPPLALGGLKEAILQTQGDVAQADVVGRFFEPDQRLAIEAHFEAIAEAGADGGLEGESPFSRIVVGPRILQPEFDLDRPDGDGVRAVTDVGPIGIHS